MLLIQHWKFDWLSNHWKCRLAISLIHYQPLQRHQLVSHWGRGKSRSLSAVILRKCFRGCMRQSHKTHLTGSREWENGIDRAGFSSLTLAAPQTVWVKVRGHRHCVPSSANSSLVSRQSHSRQHSWERGRARTCSTPRLFRGLFRDSFMLFSLLLHV